LKTLDFQVLLKNQWIIVCSLVGLVALCATIVDVVTGKFGTATVAQNLSQNQNQKTNQIQNPVTPQPQPVINPKHGRQWVLDSNDSGDADGKDFAQIVNSFQDGDTVQVRPGSYNGPLALAKSVTITGSADTQNGARPSIHYSGGTGCIIAGPQVTFENVDFSETSEGASYLLTTQLQSVVQIKNCNFISRGSDCVLASETAQLIAQDCSFQTLNAGFGCYIKGSAKATIERCTFESNRGCVDCIESGSVVINDSKFNNNTSTVKDSFLVRSLSSASAELNRCTFTENTTPVIDAQGTMLLNNCRFEKNGGGFYHYIVDAYGPAALTLSGCEFVGNQYAVVVGGGARMIVDGCKFEKCGGRPTGSFAPNDANFLALNQNSQATITGTTFSDVQFAGVLIADQAAATLKDTTIQGGQYGVDLGVTEQTLNKGGSAQLENVTLSGQSSQAVRLTRASSAKMFNCHIDGETWDSSIYLNTGSVLEMAGCEVKGGKGNGLEAIASSSQVHAEQCQFLGFVGSGVLARDRAKILLTGCTLEQNDIGAQAGGGAEEAGEGGTVTLENCTIRSNRTYGVSAIHRGIVAVSATTFDNQPNQTFKDGSSSVRVR